jgi:hypothetical protein
MRILSYVQVNFFFFVTEHAIFKASIRTWKTLIYQLKLIRRLIIAENKGSQYSFL